MAPCPTDDADYDFNRRFITSAGVGGWAAIVIWLNAWYALQFSTTPAGKKLFCLLESIKAAHRSRAEGWSAWCKVLKLMFTPEYAAQFADGLKHFQKMRHDFLTKNASFDKTFWDEAQMLRSISKRMGMCWLHPEWVARARISFPKVRSSRAARAMPGIRQLPPPHDTHRLGILTYQPIGPV